MSHTAILALAITANAAAWWWLLRRRALAHANPFSPANMQILLDKPRGREAVIIRQRGILTELGPDPDIGLIVIAVEPDGQIHMASSASPDDCYVAAHVLIQSLTDAPEARG